MGAAEKIYPATYADLEAVPSHKVAELIDSTLYVFPRPAPKHATASSALLGELGPPFKRGKGGPGGWWIINEPELHLGDDALAPDLAGWRVERMPDLPETAYFAVVPDWICEVLSPSTETMDRSVKMLIYARDGVRNLWFVNPIEQFLEVYRLTADRQWLLLGVHAGDAKVKAEPFDAIELDIGELWSKPAPAK
jgi:Uma2 family endonuclease